MQLGKRIRDLRFRRGLTVQQLAEASGLSKGFISQVENDRISPSLATLRDLARALETSIAFLVIVLFKIDVAFVALGAMAAGVMYMLARSLVGT